MYFTSYDKSSQGTYLLPFHAKVQARKCPRMLAYSFGEYFWQDFNYLSGNASDLPRFTFTFKHKPRTIQPSAIPFQAVTAQGRRRRQAATQPQPQQPPTNDDYTKLIFTLSPSSDYPAQYLQGHWQVQGQPEQTLSQQMENNCAFQ